MKSPKVKICKDCRWYKHIPEKGESITGFGYVTIQAEKHECTCPETVHINKVTGAQWNPKCEDQRNGYSIKPSPWGKTGPTPGICGEEGQYWEAKL